MIKDKIDKIQIADKWLIASQKAGKDLQPPRGQKMPSARPKSSNPSGFPVRCKLKDIGNPPQSNYGYLTNKL